MSKTVRQDNFPNDPQQEFEHFSQKTPEDLYRKDHYLREMRGIGDALTDNMIISGYGTNNGQRDSTGSFNYSWKDSEGAIASGTGEYVTQTPGSFLFVKEKDKQPFDPNTYYKSQDEDEDSVSRFLRDTMIDEDSYGTLQKMDTYNKYIETIPGIQMGSSKVLNPDYQFNELDDVRSNPNYPGLGRLYNERIYAYNLPKVIFEVGTINFNIGFLAGVMAGLGMGNFEDGPDAKQSRSMMNTLRQGKTLGDGLKWGVMRIGSIFRSIFSTISGGIFRNMQVWKFEPQPALYLRFVNEILQEIAHYMGLTVEKGFSNTSGSDIEFSWDGDQKEAIKNAKKIQDPSRDGVYDISDGIGLPVVGYKGGIRFLTAMRALNGFDPKAPEKFFDGNNFSKTLPTDKDTIVSMLSDAITLAQNYYIPFKINAGTSITESFSNSTREHVMSSNLNQKSTESRQALENFPFKLGEDLGSGVKNVFGKLLTGDFGGTITSAKDMAMAIGGDAIDFGLGSLKKAAMGVAGGEMGLVAAGGGYFAMPEIWDDSSFDRSISFNIPLKVPYGDPVARFEGIMMPLSFLLPTVMPRGFGANAYVSPFYIRAWAKSLFSSEACIVSNLSITKGNERNERTVDGGLCSYTVSMSLKEVMPKKILTMDGGIWSIITSKNIGFHEYLADMAGMDIIDKVRLKTKIDLIFNKLNNGLSKVGIKEWMITGLASTSPVKFAAKMLFKLGIDVSNTRTMNDVYSLIDEQSDRLQDEVSRAKDYIEGAKRSAERVIEGAKAVPDNTDYPNTTPKTETPSLYGPKGD